MTANAPPLEVHVSRHFLSWLAESGASLAFTTYQTNRLFLIGLSDAESSLSSALTRLAAALATRGEFCHADHPLSIGSDVEAASLGLAAEVRAGADLLDRSEETRKPSADHGDAALRAARERFLRASEKAIQKAA